MAVVLVITFTIKVEELVLVNPIRFVPVQFNDGIIAPATWSARPEICQTQTFLFEVRK